MHTFFTAPGMAYKCGGKRTHQCEIVVNTYILVVLTEAMSYTCAEPIIAAPTALGFSGRTVYRTGVSPLGGREVGLGLQEAQWLSDQTMMEVSRQYR